MSSRNFWLSAIRCDTSIDMNDTRLSERYPVRVACRMEDHSNSTVLRGYVTNISVGGCYVRMKRPFLRGARMYLTILLSAKTLAFRSIVRHAEPDSGMGLEF